MHVASEKVFQPLYPDADLPLRADGAVCVQLFVPRTFGQKTLFRTTDANIGGITASSWRGRSMPW